MGLLNGLQSAGQQLRGKTSRTEDAAPEGSEPDETSVLCVSILQAYRESDLML